MRVARDEMPAAQALQRGMRDDGRHQLPTHALAAMRRHDEDVRDVGEHGVVGDHAREADLRAAVVRAEAKRVLDRRLHQVERDVRRPIRLIAQESMDECHIEPAFLGADFGHSIGR